MGDLKGQLKKWDKKQKKKRPKEELSERELKELMGINDRTYRRAKGGAFRQR